MTENYTFGSGVNSVDSQAPQQEAQTKVNTYTEETRENTPTEAVKTANEAAEISDNEPPQASDSSSRFIPTTFAQGKEYVKLQSISDTLKDDSFRRKSAEKSSEILEQELEVEKQKVELTKADIEKNKSKVLSETVKQKYGSKLDKQEYHHRKLKPFMDFWDINDPTAILAMYAIAILGSPVFAAAKIINVIIIKPIKSFFNLFKKDEKRKYANRLDNVRSSAE